MHLYSGILKVLNDFSLSILKMRGLGSDNASVMVGINNGVYQKLLQDNPAIILVPCVCHSLQLAVSTSAAECLPALVEFLIAETFNFFSKSAQRQNAYDKFYKILNDGENLMRIVRSCQTGWISIYGALKSISSQWVELKQHFEDICSEENNFKAEILKKKFTAMKKPSVYYFLGT